MIGHCIVTGAYGLVGQHICKVIEHRYPEVKITKIKCDDIPYDCDKADWIVHAAGYGQPLMFSKDRIKTIKINTDLTDDLFQHLKIGGTFLFVSTSEVYSGAESPHTIDDIGTTTPQHERACYIEGKRCGEAICMAYGGMGANVKIARLALAYGPGTKKGDTRVINHFIEQALTKKEITLLDRGEAFRTYIYVQDAAEILVDILFKGKQTVYNVGGFSEIRIRELADMIAMMTKSTVVFGNKHLIGSPESVKLDMSKTLQEFPRAFVSMYTGLIKTIEYQKELYDDRN